MKCERDLSKKKKINIGTVKMTANSQLLTNTPKTKTKLNTHLEQKQNHRNGDHREGYQQRVGGGEGGKVQRIRSINGR